PLTAGLIRQSGWVTEPGRRRERLSSGPPSGQIASLLSEGTDLTRTRAPHELRRSLTAALTRLVGLEGARQCLVIALDAAQWIDAESLAVLDEVVPMLADARVVLIEAALPEWQHPSPTDVHRLRLERFSSAECAEVISLLLRSREIDSAAVQTLAQQSGGNPLLLEE